MRKGRHTSIETELLNECKFKFLTVCSKFEVHQAHHHYYHVSCVHFIREELRVSNSKKWLILWTKPSYFTGVDKPISFRHHHTYTLSSVIHLTTKQYWTELSLTIITTQLAASVFLALVWLFSCYCGVCFPRRVKLSWLYVTRPRWYIYRFQNSYLISIQLVVIVIRPKCFVYTTQQCLYFINVHVEI